jgi:hypothetical protein
MLVNNYISLITIGLLTMGVAVIIVTNLAWAHKALRASPAIVLLRNVWASSTMTVPISLLKIVWTYPAADLSIPPFLALTSRPSSVRA